VGTQPGRVFADEVENRRPAALCVVQIGDAVGKSRSQMQKGQRRLFSDASVTVGRARADALEKPQHRPDLGNLVERRNKVQFRRAGIGKTNFHSRSRRRLKNTFRSGHHLLLFYSYMVVSSSRILDWLGAVGSVAMLTASRDV